MDNFTWIKHSVEKYSGLSSIDDGSFKFALEENTVNGAVLSTEDACVQSKICIGINILYLGDPKI